ncbi:DUF1827 family protein [Enterococcus asini]|uniref:DUF1827 family protein n=1 Tax=Enterococcus asini TaxID=57732 RepID=UPI0028925EA1|nr:DUF1827 family protein [Enterococcus asini]MDT2756042.1 DUF1827 family protein [Enterococcus asini]
MKLIESPINRNLNLKTFYPNITQYLFDNVSIKYYKLYTLDRVQIIYVDTYDKIYLVMLDTKKKIKRTEVDMAIHRLLHTERDQVNVDVKMKQRMLDAGVKFSVARKDIVVVSMDAADSTGNVAS